MSRILGIKSDKSDGAIKLNAESDKSRLQHWVNVLPGEIYVTQKPEVIRTVLGSCVSVCIRDPINNVAGMNHFLLAKKESNTKDTKTFSLDSSDAARYGNWSMELLINEMLKQGAKKKFFEIKVFGGANVIQGMTKFNIGDANVEFVLDFLSIEGFHITSKDVGTEFARKIIFNTESGQVEVQKMLGKSKGVFESESKIAPKVDDMSDNLDDGIDFF